MEVQNLWVQHKDDQSRSPEPTSGKQKKPRKAHGKVKTGCITCKVSSWTKFSVEGLALPRNAFTALRHMSLYLSAKNYDARILVSMLQFND